MEKHFIKSLDYPQIKAVYHKRIKNDFPANELKPFSSIERGLAENRYDCIGLFDGEDILGYAFFAILKTDDMTACLLDYLAIEKSRRNTGLGSEFFTLLSDYLKNVSIALLETENTEYAVTDEEKRIQTARQNFYRKNNCADTGITARVFGAEYNIYKITAKSDYTKDEIREIYLAIYRRLVLPKFHKEILIHD
ncbi:MAG: hypothetical protein IJR59_01805 [Firmicutes bacterium]|nr:hypothetical protein [Bacillota bacterium]